MSRICWYSTSLSPGLDPVGVDVMSEILRERASAGVPVVFSSHQLELVERLCDSVVMINTGRKVLDGSVEELTSEGRSLSQRFREQVGSGG